VIKNMQLFNEQVSGKASNIDNTSEVKKIKKDKNWGAGLPNGGKGGTRGW